jgi:hypothetical protein
VPVLPFVVPQLGAFVRLEIDEDEVGQEHEFRFALTDPDGVPVGLWPSFRAELPPPPPDAPELEDGEQRFVVLAINIPGIQLGRRGLHHFEFQVDGELMGDIPLPVTTLTREQLEAATQAVRLPSPRPADRPNRAARRHPPRRH